MFVQDIFAVVRKMNQRWVVIQFQIKRAVPGFGDHPFQRVFAFVVSQVVISLLVKYKTDMKMAFPALTEFFGPHTT